MNTSESIKEIATALIKAQGQMGGVVKNQKNPFVGSRYADLNSILQVIKKPLNDNGLTYVQFPISDQQRVGVLTRLMHTSGEFLESGFTVNLEKNTPQGSGSAITYCRRYSLQSLLGIPAVDDDGEAAEHRSDNLCGADIWSLRKLIKELGATEKKICDHYNISSLDQMSKSLYDKVTAKLKEKIAKKEIDHEK